MKKIMPKINLDKKWFKKKLAGIIGYKRLLFIIFFGILLIFTFDTVYKYAFININYINYTKGDDFIIIEGRINNANLNQVLRSVEERNDRIKNEIVKKYRDPFNFENPEYPEEF